MSALYICDKELEYTFFNLEIEAPNNILRRKQKMDILEGIHSWGYNFINSPLFTMADRYFRVENRSTIPYTSIRYMLLNPERGTLS